MATVAACESESEGTEALEAHEMQEERKLYPYNEDESEPESDDYAEDLEEGFGDD
jgi:hypothetical protein